MIRLRTAGPMVAAAGAARASAPSAVSAARPAPRPLRQESSRQESNRLRGGFKGTDHWQVLLMKSFVCICSAARFCRPAWSAMRIGRWQAARHLRLHCGFDAMLSRTLACAAIFPFYDENFLSFSFLVLKQRSKPCACRDSVACWT